MLEKIKVNELAKNLDIAGKQIVELLHKFNIEVKHSTVLEEKQLDLVFEVLTQEKDKGGAFAIPKKPAEKQPAEKQPAKAVETPTQEKQETVQPPKKEPKKSNPQPFQKREKAPKAKSDKPKERVSVVVNTRSEAVDMNRIEKAGRIEEEMVTGRFKDNVQNKQKIKKGGKFQNKKDRHNKMSAPVKKEMPVVKLEIEVPEEISVGELASRMKKTAVDVIKKLMTLGMMASVSDMVDFDTACIVAEEFDITVKKEVIITAEESIMMDLEDREEDLLPRSPVVVVMGHVDHGKTSLLDYIRHANVTAGEAGGITQHIGAYRVHLKDRDITFLDTPGHEAFTAMRARGAQVTDIAILVVAADDGIMPQTIEAINHAKAANINVIVAINKIDKEGANPERVRQELTEHGIIPEEWGGDTICVEVSAKQGTNVDELLETVLLVADMAELKANPNRQARGTVIESKLDKGRGAVATVLVQNGTLRVGDVLVAGTCVGRVRAMIDDKGRRITEAGPSVPVEILGMSAVPDGGDPFYVVEDEKKARDVAEERVNRAKAEAMASAQKASLDSLFSQIEEGKMKELDIIVKADVQGSVEAVKQSLEKISNEEVRVRVIHGGVGGINESDIMLASASNAIIVGFNVRPDANAVSSAERANVEIRLYRIIYDAIEEIEAAMKGMLDPKFKEIVLGHAEIRQTFKVSGVGTIGGSYVTDGKITRNSQARIVRDSIVIHEGVLSSLKRFKDDVKEVMSGYECGIGVENYNDIKEGDVIESFIMEEVKQ